MQIRLAVFCDGANVSKGEKLNILGAFSQIHSTTFPTIHAELHLAIRSEFTYDDAGDHALILEVQDMDGRVGLRASQQIGVPKIQPGDFVYHDTIMVFHRIDLRKPGDIFFVILWDKDEKTRIPLRIAQSDLPAPQ